jgi:hypothetical protein
MTAKEYLEQYDNADRRAKKLKAEYEKEQELIDAIRSASDNDGMPHGNGISKPTEDKALRLADKRLKWIEAELDAIAKRQEVFELIIDIDGIEGDVLYERYVNLRKWEEICILVHYSWPGVHLVHRRALDIVESRLKYTKQL